MYLEVLPDFTVLLCTREQLEVLKDQLEKGPVRLYLDATGNITSDINGRKLLHHSLVTRMFRANGDGFLFLIAEMITNNQKASNIELFLRKVSEMVSTFLY
jgi:hypothetical protein